MNWKRLLARHWDVSGLILSVLVFTLMPNLDLTVSAWFYRPPEGFFLGNYWLVSFLYHATSWLSGVFAAGLLGYPIFKWSSRHHRRIGLYLMSVLLIGPLLVTNQGLKEHWGRARPVQVTQFGGTQQFTPPLQPAHECKSNCAFVSGHAAAGFYFVAFAFLTNRYRLAWLAGSIALGTAIGLVRIVQGGHFLSDVMFCFFVQYFVAKGIYWMMNRQRQRRENLSNDSGQEQLSET